MIRSGLGLAVGACALALPWTAAFVAAAPAAECSRCAGAGTLVCPVGHECPPGALACTRRMECAQCLGADRVDCPACNSAEALRGLAEARAQAAARARDIGAAARELGRTALAAAGQRFTVFWEAGPARFEGQRRSAHELAHLHQAELEALGTELAELLALRPEDARGQPVIFVLGDAAEHLRLGKLLTGVESERPAQRHAVNPALSLHWNAAEHGEDARLRRELVHLSVHLVVTSQVPQRSLSNLGCGWVDEGLAHWFEERRFGVCDVFCQAVELDNPGGGAWQPVVRKLVQKDALGDFEGFLTRNTRDLSPGEHALSFALVDCLLESGGERFGQLCRALRGSTPVRDALLDVYGLDPGELEAHFRAWVLAQKPGR